MRRHSKAEHGNIFAVPLPTGGYAFGRVTLDTEAVLKRRLLPAGSPLFFLSRWCHLVEMYAESAPTPEFVRSKVLIPGALVTKMEIGVSWPIVGHEPVDPTTVEFPEGFVGWQTAHQVALECGEIRLIVPLTQRMVMAQAFDGTPQRQIQYFLPDSKVGLCASNGGHPPLLWPYTWLWEAGRHDAVPPNYRWARLENLDLRFSPARSEVYKHLPFPMEWSYFQKQAKLGLHLERFYE